MIFPYFLFFIFLLCAYADENDFLQENDLNKEVLNIHKTAKGFFNNERNETHKPKITIEEITEETTEKKIQHGGTSNTKIYTEKVIKKKDLNPEDFNNEEHDERLRKIADEYNEPFFFPGLRIILVIVCNVLCIIGIILLIPIILKISRKSIKLDVRETYTTM